MTSSRPGQCAPISASAGRARSSRSIAITFSAPSARSARVRPPGPGPTSTTATPSSGPAARAILRRQVEVEQEILAERLAGVEPVARHDLAQRRQPVGGERHRVSRSASFKRGDEARRIGDALAGDVERRAVIGRGAHEGQAERDVDALVEGERLDRDQALVVIHGQRDVVARPRARVEHRVGRQGADDVDPFGAQVLDRRRDDRRSPRGPSRRLRRRAD